MPSRNSVKEFAPEQFYHVYNRGVEKRNIFVDDQDYAVFIGLIKKYLTGENHNKNNRHKFPQLADKVELISYCLMPNHFHLLLYQKSEDGVTLLMRRLATGYVMYFNNKFKRVGGLFQGTYKASLINKDDYLHHISRYIHLNPEDYMSWPYSSWPYYAGRKKSAWINTAPVLDLFDGNFAAYDQFVREYNTTRKELSLLKWQLANDPEDM